MISVREAKIDDIPAITAIYNYEVTHGTSNYADQLQTEEQRREWLIGLREKQYPACVATNRETPDATEDVVGFGALTPFHYLSGYRYTATGQLYVAKEWRRRGVALKLAEAIKSMAKENGFHTVLAGVNSNNKACIGLLKSFGFEQAGVFKQIGIKNGEWQDDICLQIILGNQENERQNRKQYGK